MDIVGIKEKYGGAERRYRGTWRVCLVLNISKDKNSQLNKVQLKVTKLCNSLSKLHQPYQ